MLVHCVPRAVNSMATTRLRALHPLATLVVLGMLGNIQAAPTLSPLPAPAATLSVADERGLLQQDFETRLARYRHCPAVKECALVFVHVPKTGGDCP